MLTFCTWKDEDGTHYGITRENPRKFFNWRGWRECNPKVCNISSEDAAKVATVRDNDYESFKEIDIKDYDFLFDVIRPKLRYLH